MRILVLEPCGLHAGFIGCYGNDWTATPNLDRLAAEGIVFDQHLVDAPELSLDTDLPVRSVGCGRYAWPGGAVPESPGRAVPELSLLPGDIRCRRASWTALEHFAAVRAAVRDWHSASTPILWIEGPSLLPPWSLSGDLLGTYCEPDDDDDEGLEPWPDPPLGPVELSPDDLLRLQDTYAAVVTFWDAQLGQLLDDLRADGRLDDINIWVTARAGLPLGEHGAIGADPSSLHDELIHVPLVWRMPHGDPAGLRIGALTQPVDLLPTFADLLGVPLADVQGSSLRPLMLGRAAEVRPFACSAHGQEAWLLRTPQWAFHLAPAGQRPPRLHVKPDDRWEVNDVSARQPELVERFESALRRFAAAVVRPGPLHYPALEEA